MSAAQHAPAPPPTPAVWSDLDHAARVAWVMLLDAQGQRRSDIAATVGLTPGALLGWAWRNEVRLSDRTMQRPPEVPAPPEDPAVWTPFAPPVPMDKLTSRSCRWPVGAASGSAQMYCGCRKKRGSYCEAHAAMAYRPRAGDVEYVDALAAGRCGVPAEVTVDEVRAVLGLIAARKEVME